MSRTAKQWIVHLEKAALEILAQRAELLDPSDCLLRASLCSEHNGCVTVVFGEVMQHFRWSHTDPVDLAQTLLADLPSTIQGRSRH
jgi:hypothetical protein